MTIQIPVDGVLQTREAYINRIFMDDGFSDTFVLMPRLNENEELVRTIDGGMWIVTKPR